MSKDDTFNTISQDVNDLSKLAIEVWRLRNKIGKAGIALGEDHLKSINSSIEKIESFLEKNNIETVDFTGKKYSDGLNIDVLSFNNENNKDSIITETVEPMIKYKGTVSKRAKVIVTK